MGTESYQTPLNTRYSSKELLNIIKIIIIVRSDWSSIRYCAIGDTRVSREHSREHARGHAGEHSREHSGECTPAREHSKITQRTCQSVSTFAIIRIITMMTRYSSKEMQFNFSEQK